MKRTNNEKGITLVALVITVVVLLIIAGVAVTTINNTEIIGKTNSAADMFNKAQANESTNLIGYEDLVDEYDGESNGSIVKTRTFYVDGVEFKAESTNGYFSMGKYEYTDTTITKIGNGGGEIVFVGDLGYNVLYVINGITYNLYDESGVVRQGDTIKDNYTIKLQS